MVSPPTLTEFSERQMAESEVLQLIAEHAPLGILSLAAVLELKGAAPDIIDLNHLYHEYVKSGGEGGVFRRVLRELEESPCDVFAFGTICSTYPLTLRLAREVKRGHPEAKVILGGPQASVVDVATLKAFPFVDFVVRGEAEVTLPLLLDSIAGGGAGSERINGVTGRKGGEVFRSPNAPVIEDLDGLPLPAFHLYPHMEECRLFPLEAGRGCPFACSFCSTNDFFRRRFRMKSPEVILDQMRLLNRRYGADSFDLVHDMFTVDRKRVVSFCEAVEASGENFSWSCSARTDCADEELLDVMARAGCDGVFFGIDSGSERMQEVLNKRLDLGEAATRIRRAARRRMRTTVSLITGFPEETEEDMRATVRFFGDSLRHELAEVQLHLLAPLAETPVTTRHLEELSYDDIFSDMSFQGWEQDPEDRELIVAHRDIFTNFYAVPTRWLDRRYLMELREFLLIGSLRLRTLLTFLHQDSGDLSRVFDEWKRWLPAGRGGRAYYRGRDFPDDQIKFVRSRYAETTTRPHLATTMAEVEAAVYGWDRQSGAAPHGTGNGSRVNVVLTPETVPVLAGGLKIVRVAADYKRLMRCVKRGVGLDRIPPSPVTLLLSREGSKTRILQPNSATRELLSLCDGSRNLSEVVDSFAPPRKAEGVPAAKAALYGLISLCRSGLIEVKAAAC